MTVTRYEVFGVFHECKEKRFPVQCCISYVGRTMIEIDRVARNLSAKKSKRKFGTIRAGS